MRSLLQESCTISLSFKRLYQNLLPTPLSLLTKTFLSVIGSIFPVSLVFFSLLDSFSLSPLFPIVLVALPDLFPLPCSFLFHFPRCWKDKGIRNAFQANQVFQAVPHCYLIRCQRSRLQTVSHNCIISPFRALPIRLL